MPHARIDMHRTLAPQDARHQCRHPPRHGHRLRHARRRLLPGVPAARRRRAVLLPHLPNQQRDDIIFIELIASKGYSDQQKQHTMEAIVDEVSALGIKRDNLLLVINEVGQGATWYAPEPAYERHVADAQLR